MKDLFKKTWILLVLNFIFICCYHIHIVHGKYSCVSMDSVPSEEFTIEKIHTIAFFKHVVLELARNMHVTLGFENPLEPCDELANVTTTHWTWGGRVEYSMDDETNEAAAKSVDTAIQRLLKSGHFSPMSPFIQEIRLLKLNYCRGYELSGLVINKEIQFEAPPSTQVLFNYYDSVKINSRNFLKMYILNVEKDNLLYVGQEELAVVKSDDPSVRFLGSGDSSPGIIVMLKHTGAQVHGIAQLGDSDNILAGITYLVKRVVDLSAGAQGRLEVRLVGSYLDYENIGEKIFSKIMQAIHEQSEHIHLMMACVGQLNTDDSGDEEGEDYRAPIIKGAVIDLDEDMIYPAYFQYKGPELPVRMGRIMAGNQNIVNIYDNMRSHLIVGPFYYTIWPGIEDDFYKSDDTAQEEIFYRSHHAGLPSNFIESTREALEFLMNNPDPWDVFPNNKEHRYRRDTVNFGWIQVKNDSGKGKGTRQDPSSHSRNR